MTAPTIQCDPGAACVQFPESSKGSIASRTSGEAHWHPSWDAALGAQSPSGIEAYEQALENLARRHEDAVALALTVPFCATRCLCCDRDIHTAQPGQVIDDYVDTLIEEIRSLTERVGGRRDVLQLHVGGGTATEFDESHLARIVHALERHWRLPADADVTVECDPRRVSQRKLRLMRALGFRHIVFGLFDLDPAVQRAIGRIHSAALIDDVCDMARGAGFETITLELMIGLPHQSATCWQATLLRLLALAPDRVRLARYRHRPAQVPVQYGIDAWALPSSAECEMLAAQAADMLCEAGYHWIGTDLFVLDTDTLAAAFEAGQLRRSLIGFTAKPDIPLLGLGVGASGEMEGNLFRNHPSMSGWAAAVHSRGLAVTHAMPVTGHQAQRRRAAEQMLCTLELPAATTRGGLEDAYARIARHARDGLVRLHEDRIVITRAGQHALAMLCAELLDTPAR